MKRILGLLTALTLSSPAAAIYKCVDAEGNVGFSEVPCTAEEQASEVNVGYAGPKLDARTCELASLYAEDVFTRMRRNPDSGRELDRYGGVYGAGAAILGVVNYVYGFRHDESASARRVASLSRSKCENGGFGRIRFDELPRDEYFVYDEYLRAWVRKGEGGGYPLMPSSALAMPHGMRPPTSPSAPTGYDASYQPRERCRKMQEMIDNIDAQGRNGYSASQGEQMRERRRALRDQINANCR